MSFHPRHNTLTDQRKDSTEDKIGTCEFTGALDVWVMDGSGRLYHSNAFWNLHETALKSILSPSSVRYLRDLRRDLKSFVLGLLSLSKKQLVILITSVAPLHLQTPLT